MKKKLCIFLVLFICTTLNHSFSQCTKIRPLWYLDSNKINEESNWQLSKVIFGLNDSIAYWSSGYGKLVAYNIVSENYLYQKYFDYSIYSMCFNKPKEELVISGMSSFNIIDIKTFKILHEHIDTNAHYLSSSINEIDQILALGRSDGKIELWDLVYLEIIDVINLEDDKIIWSLQFIPEKKLLVISHGEGSLTLWDFKEKRAANTLSKSHLNSISSIAVHPQLDYFATTDGNSIMIWDINGKMIKDLGSNSKNISYLTFNENNLLTGVGYYNTLKFWDTDFNMVELKNGLVKRPVDEQSFLNLNKGFLAKFDLSQNSKDIEIYEESKSILKIELLSNQLHIAVLNSNNTIKHISLNNFLILDSISPLPELSKLKSRTNTIKSHPIKNVIANGNIVGDLFLWNLSTRQNNIRLISPKQIINNIDFSPDGDLIINSFGGTIIGLPDFNDQLKPKLSNKYSIFNNSLILNNDFEDIIHLAISHDGNYLAASFVNKIIKLWSLTSGELLIKKTFHEKISKLNFFRDDDFILLGDERGNLKVVDFNLNVVKEKKLFESSFMAIIPTLDNHHIICANNKIIKIIKFNNFDLIHNIEIPDSFIINSIVFSHVLNLLVIGGEKYENNFYSGDATNEIWLRGLAYSKDGRKMIIIDDDGGIQLYKFENCPSSE